MTTSGKSLWTMLAEEVKPLDKEMLETLPGTWSGLAVDLWSTLEDTLCWKTASLLTAFIATACVLEAQVCREHWSGPSSVLGMLCTPEF